MTQKNVYDKEFNQAYDGRQYEGRTVYIHTGECIQGISVYQGCSHPQ